MSALADRVVVASKFVRESLISVGYPREKIWVTPSGAQKVDTSLRRLDSKKFVILVAGHLSARKGTYYLLEAWRRLSPPEHVELPSCVISVGQCCEREADNSRS